MKPALSRNHWPKRQLLRDGAAEGPHRRPNNRISGLAAPKSPMQLLMRRIALPPAWGRLDKVAACNFFGREVSVPGLNIVAPFVWWTIFWTCSAIATSSAINALKSAALRTSSLVCMVAVIVVERLFSKESPAHRVNARLRPALGVVSDLASTRFPPRPRLRNTLNARVRRGGR